MFSKLFELVMCSNKESTESLVQLNGKIFSIGALEKIVMMLEVDQKSKRRVVVISNNWMIKFWVREIAVVVASE